MVAARGSSPQSSRPHDRLTPVAGVCVDPPGQAEDLAVSLAVAAGADALAVAPLAGAITAMALDERTGGHVTQPDQQDKAEDEQ
jgi:hypothetical protein